MADTSMLLQLPLKWAAQLRDLPESGMSYQIITVSLVDGRRIERVPYCAGYIDLSGLPECQAVPFSASDVSAVVVTHDKSGPPRVVS